MKTLLIVFATLFCAAPALADPTATLLATLESLKTAKTPAQWQQTARQLAHLSDQHPRHAHAAYWASYAHVVTSFMSDDADDWLDRADRYVARAEERRVEPSEVMALRAYVAQARLAAKPMFRWITYGRTADEWLARAEKADPANPRPALLRAMSLYHKPAAFGGGPEKACPLLREAAKKFATFTPISPLHPHWGQHNLNQMMANCPK